MNVLLAVVAVLGVSASGPLMAATNAPVLAIAFWRNAAATVVLAPVAIIRSRDELRGVDRRIVALTASAGIFLAGHFAAWVAALQLTSVAAATALVTTQLVWIVLLDQWRGRPAEARVLLGCAASVGGVLVVSGVDFADSARALAGDGLAVLGGLCAALYLAAGEQARTRLTTTMYTTACYGTCSAVLLVAALLAGVDLVGLDARAWLLIGAVTVCAQLLGHTLLNHLLAVISPLVISLLLLLEVPGAALLAAAALGQSPPAGVYLGLVLVVVGLAVVVTGRRPQEQQPLEL